MQIAWLISYVALWVLTLLLCATVFSLMRLMGRMQQRLGPAPALVMESGPKIGDSLIDVLRETKINESGVLGFPKTRDSLLIFISPGCPACEGLYPGLSRFKADHNSDVEVILISSSANKEHNRVLSEDPNLKRMLLLALPELTPALNIGSTPYALWLDEEGTVRAKGLTATLEHLQSLWHARQLGVASVNEYRRKMHGAPEVAIDVKELA